MNSPALPPQHPAHRFPHPEPERAGRDIVPVFLPFAGCPQRCLYCAQDIQSGQAAAPLPALLAAAEAALPAKARVPAPELGFYGGTFTALPEAGLERCLAFARRLKQQGRIGAFRCSTRPDAVDPGLLARLREAGCAVVELGVQSFNDAALRTSGRGYDGGAAEKACRLVAEAGLDLGIQLMPGLPGLSPAGALDDAETAARLRPACVRRYPCVVFAGSALARLWERGAYVPLETDEAVELLARSCLRLWPAGARVIRMGLADPDRLRPRVVAGPLHPSLGNLARIRAAFLLVEKETEHFRKVCDKPLVLRVPRSCQGEAFAPAGSTLAPYAGLGIARVEVHSGPDFLLAPA